MFWNRQSWLPLLFGAVLAGCGSSGSKPPAETSTAPPKAIVKVAASKVTRDPWTSGVELTGTVRARTTTAVSARATGYIRDLRPQVGDSVAAGQVLVVIDSRDLDAAARQAEAAETEARSAIAEVETAGRSALAQLDLARVTHQRMQQLFSKSSISKQEMDEANMRLKVAESAVESVASKRKQLDAKIAQAQEAVQISRLNKAYAEVRAPFAGVVTARKAEPGTLASPGMPLLTIEQSGAYRAEIVVDESKLRDIHIGSTVTVVLEALGKTFPVRVTEVVPAIEPDSRGFVVKADLPAAGNLRSGLFVRARFEGTGAARQVLTVDASDVRMDGQLQSVLVADNGVARERLVRTGEKQGSRIEILSGLNEGDLVIARRQATGSVQDGDRVEVRQ